MDFIIYSRCGQLKLYFLTSIFYFTRQLHVSLSNRLALSNPGYIHNSFPLRIARQLSRSQSLFLLALTRIEPEKYQHPTPCNIELQRRPGTKETPTTRATPTLGAFALHLPYLSSHPQDPLLPFPTLGYEPHLYLDDPLPYLHQIDSTTQLPVGLAYTSYIAHRLTQDVKLE